MEKSPGVEICQPLGYVKRQRHPDGPGQLLVPPLDQLLHAPIVDELQCFSYHQPGGDSDQVLFFFYF